MKLSRAFSLIELLVVIAIIALIAGLALPAIVNSRKTAQNAVGQVNQRSMHQIHIAFTTDHRGEFYNPFAGMQESDPIVIRSGGGYKFGYATKSRYTTEGFMAFWYGIMAEMHPNESVPIEACVNPADGDTISAIRNAAGSTGTSGLAPGSFYYSPTFWRSPDLYTFTVNTAPCCPNEYGPMYRGDCCDPCNNCAPTSCCDGSRNNLDMVSSPSGKVMLYERADFLQTQRTRIDGSSSITQPRPPAWNNPRARPNVMTVDGSIIRADMRDLTARAAESIRKDKALTYLPVDLLNVPDKFSQQREGSGISIDGHTNTDGMYPMFFAATRNGIRGRDLPR